VFYTRRLQRLLQGVLASSVHAGGVHDLQGVPRPGLQREELRESAGAVASQSFGNDQRRWNLGMRRLSISCVFEAALQERDATRNAKQETQE
jgi:hypothetical protein